MKTAARKGNIQKTPVHAEFKPPAGKRSIRFAAKKDALEAGQSAVRAYPTVFERLAK